MFEHMKHSLLSALFISFACTSAFAGEADILDVKVSPNTDGTYRFSATVQHADTGWDHYADAFDIVAPDGTVLGTRILAHPHVNEQPFTRSLSNVKIPPTIKRVIVRARDKVHGYGGGTIAVELNR